jgi:rod shape-determining protein MreC
VRKQVRIVLAVAIAVAIFLAFPMSITRGIKDSVREWVTPLQASPHLVGARARELRESATGGERPALQRRELEQQVAGLRLQMADLLSLEQENARLRSDLNFAQKQKLRLVAAEVIGRDDVSGWWKTVRIDRGSDDGIAADRPVMAPGGLVGRTHRVDSRTCDVLLLTDTTVRVGVRLARTGVNGVVRGMGSESRGRELEVLCAPRPLRLDYVSVEADVQKGDQIVTSGLGGVFPPDLRVGTVLDVTEDSSGLCRAASVDPAVELDGLRYVFVVLR